MKNCDIIIPVWNQLEHTKTCLEHILRNTDIPYRIILIDNASDSETKDYLESFSLRYSDRVKLIHNESNLGYIKAINQGMALSIAPYVVMMNNDTMPGPGWLRIMMDFADLNPDVGLINPQCAGHEDMSVEDYAKKLSANKGQYMEMNQCQGFAMLVKRELIEKIGFLDEAFGIGGYDDTDYSMRAHKVGYRSVSIKNSYVYHRIHASFDKAGNREEWVKRNRSIYYKKWGKHLRIGVIFSVEKPDYDNISNMVKFVYGLAREWSWAHAWINTKTAKVDIIDLVNRAMKDNSLAPHQNIRFDYMGIPDMALQSSIAIKMIERLRRRMRDKRFDAIIALNGSGNFIVKSVSSILGIPTMNLSLDNFSDLIKAGRETAIGIKIRRDGK